MLRKYDVRLPNTLIWCATAFPSIALISSATIRLQPVFLAAWADVDKRAGRMTKEVSLRHLSPQYDAISPDDDSELTTYTQPSVMSHVIDEQSAPRPR